MSINYPVKPNDKWSIYSISQEKLIAIHKKWPVGNGGPIIGADPDHIYLKEIKTPNPPYNRNLYKLIPDQVIKLDENVLEWTWKLEPRYSNEELIEMAKSEKIKEINDYRDNKELSGFTYNDVVYDSNRDSILRISNAAIAAQAAIAANQPFEITWTAADNSPVVLTALDVISMQHALMIHSNTCHVEARSKKDEVSALTDVTEILKYEIDT